MRANLAIAVVASCASGCVHQTLRVERGEVFAHVPELRQRGEAPVELEGGGTLRMRVDQTVQVEQGDQMRRLTVGTLIDHCPDVAPFREDRYRGPVPCLLEDVDHVVLGSRRQANGHAWKVATTGALVLGAIGGMVACASECTGGVRTASDIGLGTVGVATLLVMMPLAGLGW